MNIFNLFQMSLKGYFDYVYCDSVILDCGCHAGRITLKVVERLLPETVIGLEYGSEFWVSG